MTAVRTDGARQFGEILPWMEPPPETVVVAWIFGSAGLGVVLQLNEQLEEART